MNENQPKDENLNPVNGSGETQPVSNGISGPVKGLEFEDDTVQALLAKARKESEMRVQMNSINKGVLTNVPPGVRGELANGNAPRQPQNTPTTPIESPVNPSFEQQMVSQNPEEIKEKSLLKNLRTYQGDIAEALKNQNASSISIAMAERRRAEKRPVVAQSPAQKQREKRNLWLALGSATFLVIGLAILGGLYYVHVENLPVPVAEAPKTIISFDKETEILFQGLTRDKFMSIIYDVKNTINLPANQIQYLHIVKRATSTPQNTITQDITANDFFSLIKTRAGSSVTRSLAKTFMLGIYQGKKTDVFMLVGLTSYENAFDGIFRWEDFMWDDLGALFSSITHATPTYMPIINQVGTTTASSTNLISSTSPKTATSTATTSAPLLDSNKVVTTPVTSVLTLTKETFIDKIISNKDARILQSQFGESVLVYGFVTKNLLLITSSEESFKAILDRVFASQAQ